jgi:phosphatidylinositol 3-kinase
VFQDVLRLPIDPRLRVTGIDASDALIFKSATNPIRLTFRTPFDTRKMYRVIFKIGDNLRQDQLIIQIIQVMDGLLRKNGLDLKLTPYNVLACSNVHGFVECVTPSYAFDDIITKSGDVRRWLQQQCKNVRFILLLLTNDAG